MRDGVPCNQRKQCLRTPDKTKTRQVAFFIGKNPYQSHSIPHARTTLKAIANDPERSMVVIDPRAVERKSMAKAFDALDRYEAAVQLLMLPSDIPTRIGRHRGTPAPEPIAEDADTAGIFDSGPAAVDFVRGTTEEHAHEST